MIFIITVNSYIKLDIVYISVALIFANSVFPLIFFIRKKYYRTSLKLLIDKEYLSYLKSGFGYTLIGAFFTLGYLFDRFYISFVMGIEYFAYYSILVLLPIEFARTVDFTLPSFYSYFLKYKFLNVSFFIRALVASVALSTIYFLIVYFYYPIIFGDFYKYNGSLIIISIVYSLGLIFDFLTVHFITNLLNKRALVYFNLVNLTYYLIVGWYLHLDFNLYAFVILIFLKQLLICSFVIYRCKYNNEKCNSCG